MNRKAYLPFFILIAVFFVSGNYAYSASPPAQQTAKTYVEELGNEALTVMTNKALSKEQKKAKLDAMFAENVDIRWIGRFVMGRYWRDASEEQQARYIEKYKIFLLSQYVSRFADYSGGTFKIVDEKDLGDEEYSVSMQLISETAGNEPVYVDYRVRREDEDNAKTTFKIFDIVVEGVSMITTQRSEFASVLSNNGVDYLITQLESKSVTK